MIFCYPDFLGASLLPWLLSPIVFHPSIGSLCEVQVSVEAPQGRTTAQDFIAEASQEPGAPRGPAVDAEGMGSDGIGWDQMDGMMIELMINLLMM